MGYPFQLSQYWHHSVVRVLLLLFLLWIFPGPALIYAAEPSDLDIHASRLDKIEHQLQQALVNEDELAILVKGLSDTKMAANQCVDDDQEKQKVLSSSLATLGEPAEEEPADVARKRQEVESRQSAVEKHLASCHVLALRSDELLSNANNQIKALLARRLSARGPNVLMLISDNWNKPVVWFRDAVDFLRGHSGADLLSFGMWGGLAILLVGVATFGQYLRHRLDVRGRIEGNLDYSGRCAQAFLTTVRHYIPYLMVSSASAFFIYFSIGDIRPVPFIAVAAYGLPAYFILVSVLKMLLSPPSPAQALLEIPQGLGAALARRLELLVLLTYLGYLLFATLLSQRLPEAEMLLARAVYGTILVANLAWTVWLLMRFERLAALRWVSWLVFLTLMAVLVAEWLGYRNFSFMLLRGTVGSVLALVVLLLLSKLFSETYDGILADSRPWHRRFRTLLGVKAGDPVPGLLWLRFLTWLSLWTFFAYVLLRIWDISSTAMQTLHGYLVDGIVVGSLHIIPLRIAGALLTIAVLIAFSGWLRGRMEHTWLPRAHMERGAREALATVTGYVFIVIALLAGLGVAGFDFGSLTIIAGALSVGIGFGLQNVVNNFVSGLILLFERPIKTGDWIVVGDTEGYVRRIRIRSTQIQTFDRADVIVPNSELISGKVTNWMLHNAHGRVRVPVGVAYGTDTQRVREILEQVAREHPQVISGAGIPEPKVLFVGFGDSSLDFELRAHVANIDKRKHVISDLNFAIDKAFRETGIEIPFPQWDLHVRDLPSPSG